MNLTLCFQNPQLLFVEMDDLLQCYSDDTQIQFRITFAQAWSLDRFRQSGFMDKCVETLSSPFSWDQIHLNSPSDGFDYVFTASALNRGLSVEMDLQQLVIRVRKAPVKPKAAEFLHLLIARLFSLTMERPMKNLFVETTHLLVPGSKPGGEDFLNNILPGLPDGTLAGKSLHFVPAPEDYGFSVKESRMLRCGIEPSHGNPGKFHATAGFNIALEKNPSGEEILRGVHQLFSTCFNHLGIDIFAKEG